MTFNYDTSLESRLLNGLQHIECFKQADIEKFLSGSRIIHVYGKLTGSRPDGLAWSAETANPHDFNQSNLGNYHTNFAKLLDAIHDASVDLRVIDPHNKGFRCENIQIARMQIGNAKRLFILGYGFDENNNDRLNLSQTIRQQRMRIYFTNFENNRNINKRVSMLIFGNEGSFKTRSDWIEHGHYERSVRNVYDAFARDFDL